MKVLIIFITSIFLQACCSGDSRWVRKEKFYDLAVQAILEIHPQMERSEIRSRLGFIFIHCDQNKPCTTFFSFKSSEERPSLQVGVSEDGQYWVTNDG